MIKLSERRNGGRGAGNAGRRQKGNSSFKGKKSTTIRTKRLIGIRKGALKKPIRGGGGG